MTHYSVQYGDCLWFIAKKFLGSPTRWKEIANLNNLRSPDQLYVGQLLILPKKQNPQLITPISNFNQNSSRFLLNNGLPSHRIIGYPARAFFFILADEINPFTKKIVRKVIFPKDIQNDAQLV
ncbi:MAG: LysM peptidoglycan-binding domain-containing protein, partial [Rhabdochlamydiaceae bacterium]